MSCEEDTPVPRIRPKRLIAVASAVALGTTGLILGINAQAQAAANPGFPAHYSAPYAEM
jgi:hypothetical protein